MVFEKNEVIVQIKPMYLNGETQADNYYVLVEGYADIHKVKVCQIDIQQKRFTLKPPEICLEQCISIVQKPIWKVKYHVGKQEKYKIVKGHTLQEIKSNAKIKITNIDSIEKYEDKEWKLCLSKI